LVLELLLNNSMKANYIELLKEAITKQEELIANDLWKKQLLVYAPPILWFGNNNSKIKIVTIGANPSRSEFLDGNNKSLKDFTFNNLPYLDKENQRFYQHYQAINLEKLNNNELIKIIDSYNSYFFEGKNPYKKWFGKKFGGKVEALANSFNASFYESELHKAIHIDLFPFATFENFSKIKSLAKKDLFKTEWAPDFLSKLLKSISPEIIIIFGNSNYNLFRDYFMFEQKNETITYKAKSNKSEYYLSEYNGIILVGLRTNFGNPIGLKRDDILTFGKEIQESIQNWQKKCI